MWSFRSFLFFLIGFLIRNSNLIIVEKLKFNPLPVAKKMELGLANKIPCKAEGSDPPTIKWKKVR